MAYKRKERQGFLILHRNRVQLEFLTDEQRGQLLMALLNFSEFGEKPQFDGVLGMAFATMAEQIAFYADTWKERCEQARLNRSKRVQTDNEQTSTDVDHRQPASTLVNTGDQSNQSQNKTKTKSPHTPQGGGQGQVDEDFSRFWDAYPRRQKKKDARRAFEKALRKASLETIIQALEDQKRSEQWTKDGGKFIPLPSSWLNAEQWEDEVSPLRILPESSQGSREPEPVYDWNEVQFDDDGQPMNLEECRVC